MEDEIKEPENNVIGGRYPSSMIPICGTMNERSGLLEDKRLFLTKPYGNLHVDSVYKGLNNEKRVKLRFDDHYKLEVWIEFDMKLSDLVNSLKHAELQSDAMHVDDEEYEKIKDEE
jgi:hypothetical protein